MKKDKGRYWFDNTVGHVYESFASGLQLKIVDKVTLECIQEGRNTGWSIGERAGDDMMWDKSHWKLIPQKSDNFNSLYNKLNESTD